MSCTDTENCTYGKETSEARTTYWREIQTPVVRTPEQDHVEDYESIWDNIKVDHK